MDFGKHVQYWPYTHSFSGYGLDAAFVRYIDYLKRWPMHYFMSTSVACLPEVMCGMAPSHGTCGSIKARGNGVPARQERQPGQGTRMEGMGACTWEAATTKGMAWPANPVATGCQGNPCSTSIRWGCLPQPRWAVCATGAGAHQGQTSHEGKKDIWWTVGTTRGAGHLGLTDTETQRGRLWTACGQRCVDSKNSQTKLATTSTTSIRQPLGATDTQAAHHATSSTAPAHQPLGSANAETTPARATAAAADRKQQPNATCEGQNGSLSRTP